MRTMKLLASVCSRQGIGWLVENLMVVAKAAWRFENQTVVPESTRAPCIEAVWVCFLKYHLVEADEASDS